MVRRVRSTGPFVGPVGRADNPPGHRLMLLTPRVVRLGEAVLDVVGLADHVKAALARAGGVPVARQVGELDAACHWARTRGAFDGSIGERHVGLVRAPLRAALPGQRRQWAGWLIRRAAPRRTQRSIDGHEQVELALLRAHLGYVHVDVAERVGLERAPSRLVAFPVRRSRDAMALQASAQRRARQLRDRGLQSVRGSRMAAEACAGERPRSWPPAQALAPSSAGQPGPSADPPPSHACATSAPWSG